MATRRRAPSLSSTSSSFIQSFKDLDAYAKPLDDFRVKTLSGAAVTICSGILIMFLVLSEFWDWRTATLEPSLEVDKARKEKLQINLNVTLPKVPCFMLSVDVMDVAGEHQNDVAHDMFKIRLDPTGNAIQGTKGELGDQQKDLDKNLEKQKDPKYCGSCYDGKKPPSGCCNTCDDVVKAYKDVGWAFSYENAETIEQCQKEHWVEKMKSQSKEGCRIQGKIEVNKVAGNVHLAPGASFQQNNLHVHDLNPYLKPNLSNFAHQIHSLSFGESVGIQNPLDGVEKKTDDQYETFQYYIKVVSTRFVFMNGTVVHTNQFSATEHERSTKHSTGLPGIFFNYDISPMLVIYTEYQKPLSHFLTDICAIVGGVFTVAGILDSFIYTAERTLKKKMELGKAS